MKGIILAGGSGTRLYPMTKSVSKQMLPVYDKPMIYYPLSTLMQFGIRDILVISTPHDTPVIEKLLGDGMQWGIRLSYEIQPEPKGIAQAFTIGEKFINKEQVALILGDNIFYSTNFGAIRREAEENPDNATIVGFEVKDPERFGVLELDKAGNVLSIEEKPKRPKSNVASAGLYFYPADVSEKAGKMEPSARGELEITDLSKQYLDTGRLRAVSFSKGSVWLDAGTPDSLNDASNFVRLMESNAGVKIGCVEEIALNNGFIDAKGVQAEIEKLKNNKYANYLERVIKGR